MDEENKIAEPQEESLLDNDDFKEAVRSKMRELHNQGMVVGFQTACHTVLDKIYAFERSPGKKSTNDYKRLVKDLKKFCETGISRSANFSTTTEPVEKNEDETVQN